MYAIIDSSRATNRCWLFSGSAVRGYGYRWLTRRNADWRLIAARRGFLPNLRRPPRRKNKRNVAYRGAKRSLSRRKNLRHLRHQNPKQVRRGCCSCRPAAARTRTLWFHDPNDKDNVYRLASPHNRCSPAGELPAAPVKMPDKDPNTALFRIDVITVPGRAPQTRISSPLPDFFIDPERGAMNVLNNGAPTENRRSMEKPADTIMHDITVYTAIGLCAGACSARNSFSTSRPSPSSHHVSTSVKIQITPLAFRSFSNDGTKVTSPTMGRRPWRALPSERSNKCDRRDLPPEIRQANLGELLQTACRSSATPEKTGWLPTRLADFPSPARYRSASRYQGGISIVTHRSRRIPPTLPTSKSGPD